jgi:hypothetical protein
MAMRQCPLCGPAPLGCPGFIRALRLQEYVAGEETVSPMIGSPPTSPESEEEEEIDEAASDGGVFVS